MNNMARPERWMLLAIILVAAIMRFYGLEDLSLSNDELSAIARTHQPDLSAHFENSVKKGDFHPAGVQTFIYFWKSTLGSDPFWLRFPFVICGILSVLLTFVVTRRWVGIYAALTAAALLATMEYPILYSRLVRPYAPGLLFSLFTLYFWSKIILSKKDEHISKGQYLGFVVSLSASMYIHHYCALFVGILGLCGLFFVKKTNRKGYILAGAASLLLYLPHIGITSYQMGIGGVGGDDGWLPPPEEGWLGEYLDYALNGSLMTAALVGLLLFKWIDSREYKGQIKFVVFSLLTGFAMIFIAYWYSIYRNPIFQHSILIFSFPLLLVVISFLITPARKNLALVTTGIVLLSGILTTSISNAFYTTEHFGDFKTIAEKTAAWTSEYGQEKITFAASVNAPYYTQFYLQDSVPFGTYLVKVEEDLFVFDSLVTNSRTPYFLFSWSTIETRPEAYAIIRRQFPYLIKDDEHFNSRVSLFSKLDGDLQVHLSELSYSFDDGWTKRANDTLIWTLASDEEYGSTIEVPLSELGYSSGNARLHLSADVRYDIGTELILVIETSVDGERIDWRGMNADHFHPEADKWKTIHLVKEFNDKTDAFTVVKVFIWSPKNAPVDLKRLHLTLSEDI